MSQRLLHRLYEVLGDTLCWLPLLVLCCYIRNWKSRGKVCKASWAEMPGMESQSSQNQQHSPLWLVLYLWKRRPYLDWLDQPPLDPHLMMPWSSWRKKEEQKVELGDLWPSVVHDNAQLSVFGSILSFARLFLTWHTISTHVIFLTSPTPTFIQALFGCLMMGPCCLLVSTAPKLTLPPSVPNMVTDRIRKNKFKCN